MKANKDTAFNYFSSRTIGRTLKEVAVDLIQTEHEDVVSRWFHSQSETDLYTWVDRRSNIIKQQLSFYGQIVEWNCVEGLKTGVVIEMEMEGDKAQKQPQQLPQRGSDELAVKPSETIHFDFSPQNKTIQLAIEILHCLEETDESFKQQLIKNFLKPETIESMGKDAFIQRFGLSLKNYQTTDHGFWDSMKKRLTSLFTSKK